MTARREIPEAPDDPVTVITAEFDSERVQDSLARRVIDTIGAIERKQRAGSGQV